MFAFAIEMPTAHRLSCLRDDLVFVVFVYQYYIYRVDLSRVNEFGQLGLMDLSFDELVTEKKRLDSITTPLSAEEKERLSDVLQCIDRKEKAARGLPREVVLAAASSSEPAMTAPFLGNAADDIEEEEPPPEAGSQEGSDAEAEDGADAGLLAGDAEGSEGSFDEITPDDLLS